MRAKTRSRKSEMEFSPMYIKKHECMIVTIWPDTPFEILTAKIKSLTEAGFTIRSTLQVTERLPGDVKSEVTYIIGQK